MRRTYFCRTGLIAFAAFLIFVTNTWAFFNDVKILTSEEIHQLSDQALTDTYIDAQIDVIAQSTFFQRAGIVPRDYAKFKELLRYRVDLIKELQKRNLEIPKTEP